ncbi:hypothetical protein [Pseudomonas chlororaphis]|uniref:hypothetical protein n=1 Tax=Pseudomonas chlororaphis TaxID=587753 RepID=UPI000BE39923|nr:hypothetical protein [Pseudomonas chlororaphis]
MEPPFFQYRKTARSAGPTFSYVLRAAVAAAERSGRKPHHAIFQANPVRRFGEDYVLDRSLAALGSGYMGYVPPAS